MVITLKSRVNARSIVTSEFMRQTHWNNYNITPFTHTEPTAGPEPVITGNSQQLYYSVESL